MQTNDQTPPPPPEGAGLEALDLIAAEGARLEGAAHAPAEQQRQQQEAAELDSTEAELLQALELARLMASPAFEWWRDFGRCWSDRQLQAIAKAGAQVMQRHGWTMGELMSEWGPYIALIGATVPPGLATYQAIKHRREEPPPPRPAPAPEEAEGVRP